MNNPKTWILIVFLLCIALFLGGFRLGKQVERLDKSYVPPPTPTLYIKPSPTLVIKPLTFATYAHKGCGVSFLFPRPYKMLQNASDGAELRYEKTDENNKQMIQFGCKKTSTQIDTMRDLASASGQLVIGSQTVKYYPESNSRIWFEIKNRKNKYIEFLVDKNLFEIVSKTLKLL